MDWKMMDNKSNKVFKYHDCNNYDLIDASETRSIIKYLVEDLGFAISDIAREAGVSRTNVKSLYDGIRHKKDGGFIIYINKHVYGKFYKKIYNFYDYVIHNNVHSNDLVQPGAIVDASVTKKIINQLLKMGYSRHRIAKGAGIEPGELSYIMRYASNVRKKTFVKIAEYAQSIVDEGKSSQES